ncbi:MAG: ABC transporter permease [Dehalococcoidia bacterium]|nr:ABC transporter permease [Dehalococcoidia bacterium]
MRSFEVAFFLAAKSIIRGNMSVTLLTIAMLILANLNLLFVPSLIDGIVYSANDKLIDTFSSNVIVESKNDPPVINQVDKLMERIETIDGVVAVTYRNTLGAELSYKEERTNCIVRAVVPGREKEVFKIADAVFEGSYLEEGDLDQILLGVQLAGNNRTQIEFYASSLKTVHAGDKISISYANGIKKQYRVKGIFYTEFVQTDLQAFVTEREFRSVNPLSNNRASAVYVKIRNDSEAKRVMSEIATFRDNLDFQTWQDTAGIVRSMTTSFDIIKGILLGVNLLVAGITVFIVTYIDLVNKRRQIGIGRAIGITSAAITMSYVARAVFYAILGIVISWLLYTYAVTPLEARYPFHFPFGDVALFMNRALIIRSALTILGVTIVGALLPVWRTIRIRLLDAIWG